MLSFRHYTSVTKHFVPGTTKPREHRQNPEPVLDLVELQGQEGGRLVSLVLPEEEVGTGYCGSTEEGEEIKIQLGHGVP